MTNTPYADLFKWTDGNTLFETINGHAANAEKLDNKLSEQNERLNGIDTTLISVDGRLDSTETKLTEIDPKVQSAVDAAASANTAAIAANQATVATNTAIANANTAATNANEKAILADSKATEALTQANYAKEKADYIASKETAINQFTDETTSVQTQLNNIVIESGTSDAEVIQSRGTFPVLNDRLDSVTSQLAQTAQDVESRGINVKLLPYNATGTAGQNDTLAIQQASDYAALNGLELFLPNGEFNVDTLNVKCNIIGNGNTIIKCKDILFSNVSKLSIKDVKIITVGQLDGIKITDSNFINISNTRFESLYADVNIPLPITVERCDNFYFDSNVVVVGNLQIKESKNIKIINNFFDGQFKNNHDLVKCTSRTSGLISGNIFLNSNGDAIDTYTSGERMVITNNHIENMKINGIEAKVILRDPPYTGDSSDQNGFVESTIISNNILKNIGGAASDNYAAIKNTYSDLRSTPVFEQKNTPRCFIVTNNIIEDINLTAGVSGDYHGIITDAHNSIIEGNIIRNVYKGNGGVNSGTGIYFAARAVDCLVKGNVITGAQSNGIYASANKGLNIEGNIISKDKVSNVSQAYGMRLSALERCTIANNHITDSATYAIYASGELLKSSIIGNVLENGAEFVKLTDVRINNNDVYNKPLFVGSSGQQSNRVTVTGNHVRDTGTSAGVFLRFIKGGILTNNIFNSVAYGTTIQFESTYIQAKNNTTSNQLNYSIEGIVFSSVTTENQATSVVSGNMVIPTA